MSQHRHRHRPPPTAHRPPPSPGLDLCKRSPGGVPQTLHPEVTCSGRPVGPEAAAAVAAVAAAATTAARRRRGVASATHDRRWTSDSRDDQRDDQRDHRMGCRVCWPGEDHESRRPGVRDADEVRGSWGSWGSWCREGGAITSADRWSHHTCWI